MRRLKQAGALTFVALALSAVVSANAAASAFTAGATGELVGNATTVQVFTTSGGNIECEAADTSGVVSSKESSQQHVTVDYDECSAFGVPAHVSPATYLYTANFTLFAEAHIEKTITIEVTVPLFPDCTLTIEPQTLSQVIFANNGNRLEAIHQLNEIAYTSSGGFCGSSGTDGTLEGVIEWELSGGAVSLNYDHF